MHTDILHALTDSIDRRESVALVTVTEATGSFAASLGRDAVLWPEADRSPVGSLALGPLTERALSDIRQVLREKAPRHLHYTEADGAVSLFVDVQPRPPHLIVVGAGHIAVPLAAMAKLCEFQVTVLDDRPQFANTARFPTADQVIAGPFRAELDRLRQGKAAFDNDTYIVLVTRGHQYDVESLLEVLDDPLAYIGMIGSRRRIRAVFELLETEQGIPAAKFDRVYAPIGLNIGAITPAEIAVCIMAEIINVMRGGPALGMGEEIQRERLARRQRAVGKISGQG
ncbi:MAG: XdhC family protein [Caldilineaceae bacterium]|nr:XdhC family protein [Caldilineaceae bacterium]